MGEPGATRALAKIRPAPRPLRGYSAPLGELAGGALGLGVHPVDDLPVLLVDDAALDLQRRRQLAPLDREVLGQERERADLPLVRLVAVDDVDGLLEQGADLRLRRRAPRGT